MVQSMSAASERVFEFLNEEEEDQTTENPADIGTVTGAVTLIMYSSDTIRIRSSFMISTRSVKPGQKLPLSARPEQENDDG